MGVSSVSSGTTIHQDSSAETYTAGVIAAAEQQALNWQEYNFEQQDDAAGAYHTDGLETGSRTASQRAQDAFWGLDPNRPASAPTSSPGAAPPERMNITDAEAKQMIDAGYNVQRDGNGGWVLNLTSDQVNTTVQPPSRSSPSLPGVEGETATSAAAAGTLRTSSLRVVNSDTAPQAEPGAGAPDGVDDVTGAGEATSNKIDTVLDEKVEDILDRSPTLRRLWDEAERNNWKLVVSRDVDKSHADPNAKPPTVFINPKDIGPGGDQIAKMASLVSHEMGHAATPYPPRFESENRGEFVAKNTQQGLRHEGAAAFINAKTRDEIIGNGGPDIGIRGGLDEWYISVYNDYKAGRITESQAIDRMAELMAYEPDNKAGANKQELLEQEFGRIWDEEHAR